MPSFLAMAGLSAGERLLSALLGGKKTSYQMSPEEQEIYNVLMGQYKGGVPSHVTQPIEAEYGTLKQGIKERTGEALGSGSGPETAQLMKASAGKSRALSGAVQRYKQMILGQMGGLARGGGTRTMPTDWGETVGGMGGDLGLILGLMEALKGGKGRKDKAGGYTMPSSFANRLSLNY